MEGKLYEGIKMSKATKKDLVPKQYANLLRQAQRLEVTDADSQQKAGALTLLAREGIKFFNARAKPRIEEAHKHWQNLKADLKKDLAPLEQARDLFDQKISEFRKAERAKAELAAAESRVEQTEANAERKEKLAELARKAGLPDAADHILNAPDITPPPVAGFVPAIEGMTEQEHYLFEIENPALIPAEYLIPDEVKIGKLVRDTKGTIKIPGVRIYRDTKIKATGK